MPKAKTNKAAAKRFIRMKGGLKRSMANKSHRNMALRQNRIRRLRGTTFVHPADLKRIKRLLAS